MHPLQNRLNYYYHRILLGFLCMRILSLIFGLLIIMTPLQAQVYKWTDSEGNVHYTDKPHPDAEKLDLPEVQTYSSPPTPTPQQPVTDQKVDEEKEPDDFSVAITQPQNQATIRNNQGYVPVMVSIEPELRQGYKLQMVFDGQDLGEPQASPMFALNNVLRGSHTLMVKLLSPEGEIVETTEQVTIFMHRPRVGMVPETRRQQTQ